MRKLKRLRRRLQCLVGGHMPTVEYDDGWPFLVCDWCYVELDWERHIDRALPGLDGPSCRWDR